MDIIDTSLITDPSKQQPFLGGSLAFLQNSSKEMVTAVCRSIMGETLYNLSGTTAICMSGCKFSGTLDTIFNGFIYFNGELYYFAGQAGLNAYSNAPVMVLGTTYLSPDPITFSDLSTGNVHARRRLTCTDAVLGSGLFNLKDMKYVNSDIQSDIAISTYTTTGATQESVTGATYTTPKGIVGLGRKFKITFSGYASFAELNGTYEGFEITIKNSTTATVLKKTSGVRYGNATTSGTITTVPFTVIAKTGLVDANSTIIGTLQRQATSNATIEDATFYIEEYN